MTFMKRHADGIAVLVLPALAIFYLLKYVNFGAPPFEDAAMLMRYADHLAHGYGIVWNIGEHPVDGATDFLFMLASSLLIKIGTPIGRSIRVIGLTSHVLTVLLVYWVNRTLWKANIFISFLTAFYLLLGTGFSYVAAYFGTPFFALLALVAWIFGLLLIQNGRPPIWQSLLFAMAGLLLGLDRPEGVLLAGFMLVAVLIIKGWRESSKTIFGFVLVFLIFGGAYFIWRWSYFGYPLPNPFYIKSGGLLHWDSLWESFGNLVRFGGPFLLAFLLGLRSRQTMRYTIAFLAPLVFFATSFILISNETNYGGRFQYALWPLVLTSWYPLVKDIGADYALSWPRIRQVRGQVAWILFLLGAGYVVIKYSTAQNCLLTTPQQSCGVGDLADGRYDVAKMLFEFHGKGYVIATSEAGLLPLYSHWTAVDTWGLNDEWIAHHGLVTDQYLDRYKPNVIMFHAYFSPLVPPKLNDKNLSQNWFRMTVTLMDYAQKHAYILAAAFGDSPYEAHYYYVRSDFPDSQLISNKLATLNKYYWFVTGKKSINYALIKP